MDKYRVSTLLLVLNWTSWLIRYAVVYPLAMIAMLVILRFGMGPMTLGQLWVTEIESVQREGYVIEECSKPDTRGQLRDETVEPLLPSLLQKDCASVTTDASGYAASIDKRNTYHLFTWWLIMAMAFIGTAVAINRTPSRQLINVKRR